MVVCGVCESSLFFFFFFFLTSCAIVSFECLRSLTLKPPLQMSICPSAVPLPQYECIVSKPQTFKAPLTLIRCRCVYSLLPLLQLAANTHNKENKNKNNMQPTDPKDLSLSHSHQLSHSHGSVGPHILAVVRKAGNLVCYLGCVRCWFVYLNRFLCCSAQMT